MARDNQYFGVNAHLQSYLQHHSEDWIAFHNDHIQTIRRAIGRILPVAYFSVIHSGIVSGFFGTSVLRREGTDLHTITQIELLTPEVKLGGRYRDDYAEHRNKLLAAHVRLIEIDYCHESPPHLSHLPNYIEHDETACPYSITISEGSQHEEWYGISVDKEFPPVKILPASEPRNLILDLRAAYYQTYAENAYYSQYIVDYTQLPLHFEQYHPHDQTRIIARMEAVQATYY